MMYHRSDNGETAITMYCGDVLDVLRTLPDESVQCVVTSPPYWGLRSYLPDGHRDKGLELGLEPTPEAYVARMVEVFREVRRVLRRDGTCWINLGDSYANDTKWGGESGNKNYTSAAGGYGGQRLKRQTGLKPKDLVGIPWRTAFALQADGWWLRSDVIWSKPNPMPESVSDRPTKSHEYVFLLTKSGDTTYWTHRDLPGTRARPAGPDYRWTDGETGEETADEPDNWRTEKLPDGRKRWSRQNLWQGQDYYYDAEAIKEAGSENSHGGGRVHGGRYSFQSGRNDGGNADFLVAKPAGPSGRNKRSVWTVATKPYPEAHFATFPPALIAPMILAGSSPRACEACGSPWARAVERETHSLPVSERKGRVGHNGAPPQQSGWFWRPAQSKDCGWRPTCSCPNEGKAKCIVLDPFGGAGTTALVAQRLGRDSILIDLSEEYCAMARERIAQEHDQQRMSFEGGPT